MFEQRVRNVMERRKLVLVTPQTSVSKAARLMAQKHVGAVVVVEGERLVGIFTERDALFRVIAQGLDAEATRLSEVMTPAPQCVHPEESFGHALMVMYENGFRHLPVLEDGKPVGILSARSALDPDLEDFVAEAQRRKHFQLGGH